MKTSRVAIHAATEFSPRVQLGEDHLYTRQTEAGDFIHRDAAAIVADFN